ncbi:DNA-binding protein [Ramlibacter sp. WS9]|uniref:FitA-like ribbon-helix-helix domain-containing protein n=1 Tax=Ramlibacter sp. WS9 TaxID=1882741 RepID=UPI00114307E2|nr:DNA-binding protein [Ramlibacter sp. WS9]ROZ78208.1 DNA-binding protein [Ramlibacter sp. WS9]
MSQLVVRNVDPPLVLALKQRAAKHGHSAEEEHRRILEEALRAPKKKSFVEVLMSMPDVGLDEDFARHPAKTRTARKKN